MSRSPLVFAAVVALGIAGLAQAPTPAGQVTGTTAEEWPSYGADLAHTRYRPLDQITASQFNQLEVAWHFKTDNLGPRPEFKLEGTPLMARGRLYATGGTRRSVVALDAATGELLWVHGEQEGRRAAASPRQLSGRGLAYWNDAAQGGTDERILYFTTGAQLVALDARTGSRVPSFGRDGMVDLKADLVTGTGTPIDLETGEFGLHSTPIVARDEVLVGSSFREGQTIKTHDNTKGTVRAFDVRTGRLLWTFNTIPRPGESGNETWLNGSWATNGNTGVWTQISVDEDLGLAYLPVESPSSDYYGGHRPGNNLFGESLVCVDLKTGRRKWHYQLVHHPIWNYDISSAPILADITVNGRAIKAVAVPGKQSFLYVFDRVTGDPVWPIEERPVPTGDVPGEWYSPTQPFPTKPPAYARQAVGPDDLIDFTPALHAEALKLVEKYRLGPMFNPPVVSQVGGPLAALEIGTGVGGTNWPGAAYDPETHIVYAHGNNAAVQVIGLVKPPPDFGSDLDYVAGTAGQPFQMRLGPGEGTAADATPAPAPVAGGGTGLTVQGLPLVKPPYGTISAIDLDRGRLAWQVPHGDTPDNVRNHPALKGLEIPRTGQSGTVGLLLTRTLVVAGDPQVTMTAQHPRGAMLRAYDKASGREVGAVLMPAPQSGSPMTYSIHGRQFIVVAISGGAYSGEYLAFRLPAVRPTS